MKVTACSIPPGSVFSRDLGKFYYWDSFEARLSRTELPMHEIYLSIFAHHPWWAKLLLIVRTKMVSPFGLKGPVFADFNNVEIKEKYAIGEKIGRFTLLWQSSNEIVAGGDDKHLEFRVSVLKTTENDANKVVMSTVVNPHNFFGKIYLSLIAPFHRFGVKAILSNAVVAKRV